MKYPLTEGQQAAFSRATMVLTELLNADLGLPMRPAPHPTPLWHSRDDIGIRIREAADWLTREVIKWFRAHGWLAVSFKTDVFVAPFVEEAPPDRCYHVTPACNEDGIRVRGLLRGVDAGCSTTGRADAGQHIHVSFDRESAAKWAGGKLLGKHHAERDWVMFEIARAGIVGKVFRDPSSQTGYILEAPAVAKEHLTVVRRWRPEDEPEPKQGEARAGPAGG